LIGKVLGNRYRILREVGSGGMAWVYLAEDIKENNLIAVKILYPQFGEDLVYVQRFNREAKLVSTLTDPHIVHVLDYGADRDVNYLVMEYISGRDLREVLDDHGPFSWQESLEFLDQLGAALEHAHLHGVVHRDIKPQNLMLDDSGILKVLDFGIARIDALPSLTQSGFIGSPYYVSPEQAMGEEVDIRSDIYSSSVVFYELLTGKVPFEAKSPWSVISKHISSLPPPIEFTDKNVPPEVQIILDRMGAKRTIDRFQTPTELRRAIAAVLAGQPIPDSNPEADQQSASYNRAVMSDSLSNRAAEAMKVEEWARAADLLSQVLKFNPDSIEVIEKLAIAEQQASLQSLYNAAKRSIKDNLWQDALNRINGIIKVRPDYKDVKDLQVKVQQTIEKEKNEQLVMADYEKGMAHFEASRWDRAIKAFQEVQRLYPGYKQVNELLAIAEEANKQNSSPTGQDNSKRLWWLSIAILSLVAILLGTLLFRWENSAVTVTPETQDGLKVLYQEAVQAKKSGKIEQAIALLDQIVKENPNYADVATMKRELVSMLTPTSLASTSVPSPENKLEDILKKAQEAMDSDQWSKAIELLKQLRVNDAAYEVGRVTSMFCDGYVGRGLETMSNLDPKATNQADVVKMALIDFEDGSKECPKRIDLRDQTRWASAYLEALNSPLENYDMLIQILNPVVAAEPNYANGNAKNLLYLAYLQRGDKWRKQNEMVRALSDYEAALDLKVADPSEAQTKRADLLIAISQPTKVPTNPPLPTVAATATPQTDDKKPAGTAPTPILKPTVITLTLRAAPKLIKPANDALFVGRLTKVYLEWESTKLAEDEYYDLTIMHIFGEAPTYWGKATRENQIELPQDVGVGKAGGDRFYWWITIRKKDTAPTPDGLDLALSERSETRTFLWVSD